MPSAVPPSTPAAAPLKKSRRLMFPFSSDMVPPCVLFTYLGRTSMVL